ncbi:MAG: hypothetical protein HRF42_12625 [Candidatus Brocadia sp.]|jgi:DNA-binding NtrC family response regulator
MTQNTIHKMPNINGTQLLKEVKQLLPDTIRMMLMRHANSAVAINHKNVELHGTFDYAQ